MNESFESFGKWFTDNTIFFSLCECFDGVNLPEMPFQALLQLKNKNLKPFTKDALEYLKTNDSAIDLNWGFRAYSQFQDLFTITLGNNNPFWNRHYCYFESLVYLRESIATWLDQDVLAAMTLIRPFLELSILHLYWYLRCEHKDYDHFYLWLEDKKGKPPFKDQLDFVFNNLPTKDLVSPKRLGKIKKILNNSYKDTCTYNHTPKIDESIVSLGGGTGNVSFLLFYSYTASLNIILRQLTYLYILAYPMSLFPVDRYKKWGIGGPLGIFFDMTNFAILKKYLGSDNLENIKNDVSELQEVKDLLSWFDEQYDISETEIEKNWQEFVIDTKINTETNDKEHRLSLSKAQCRSLRWFTNYYHEKGKGEDDISDEMLERTMKYINNW
jgi:hypothetical protein